MPRGGSPRGISRWLPWALVAISGERLFPCLRWLYPPVTAWLHAQSGGFCHREEERAGGRCSCTCPLCHSPPPAPLRDFFRAHTPLPVTYHLTPACPCSLCGAALCPAARGTQAHTPPLTRAPPLCDTPPSPSCPCSLRGAALCPVARGTQALGRVQELETQLQTSLVHPGLADGVPGAQARPALDIGLPLNLHLGQGVSPQRTQNATGGGGVADAQGGMSGGKRGEQGAAGLGQTGLGLPDWGTVRAWARRRKQSREQENEGGGEQEQRHEGRWQQQQGGQKQQQGGHEPLHGNPGNEFDTEEAYQ